MVSDRPCFSRNIFRYIHEQRNHHLQFLINVLSMQLFKTTTIPQKQFIIIIRHQLDIWKQWLCEHPCYHVVITCLFRCLHLLIKCDLLFSRLFPLYELILSFSFRHKWNFLLLKLYGGHSFTMLQVTFGIKLLLLISQYPFNSPVSFAYSSCVKDLVWL